MMQRQQGATLIVVLVMLVLLTLIGTWAIRQSLINLKVTTSSQAQQLLMQSSDSVFYRLAQGGHAAASSNPLSLVGYALQNQGHEVVFCFRHQDNAARFSAANSSILRWNEQASDVQVDGVAGFCSLDQAADYASTRKAQLTQVSVIVHPPGTLDSGLPLSQLSLGSDVDSIGQPLEAKTVYVYVTSILPALTISDASQEIQRCLKRPQSPPLKGTAQTLSACLQQHGVPYNSQVQSYLLDVYQRASG